MQHDGGAQLRAEGREGLRHYVTRLGLVVLAAVGHDVKARRQKTRELLAPQVRDREVDADAPKPRTWRCGRPVPIPRAERTHEGLLGEVFSRRRVEHDGSYGSVYGGVLAVVELAKLG